MWQKARIVHLSKGAPQSHIGEEVWLNGPPRDGTGQGHYYQKSLQVGQVYETNLRSPRTGGPMFLDKRAVELLPEFAETIPMEDFEAWAARVEKKQG